MARINQIHAQQLSSLRHEHSSLELPSIYTEIFILEHASATSVAELTKVTPSVSPVAADDFTPHTIFADLGDLATQPGHVTFESLSHLAGAYAGVGQFDMAEITVSSIYWKPVLNLFFSLLGQAITIPTTRAAIWRIQQASPAPILILELKGKIFNFNFEKLIFNSSPERIYSTEDELVIKTDFDSDSTKLFHSLETLCQSINPVSPHKSPA